MANNLQKKPFLDYQAQIRYLKQKQLVINDEASATIALENVSYYGNNLSDVQYLFRKMNGKMLVILTKYRNICAHGNRLFNAKTQDSIPDLTAHKKLRIPKVNSRYQQGKSDLFATVISLKYLLDATDFRLFYYELKKVIKKS